MNSLPLFDDTPLVNAVERGVHLPASRDDVTARFHKGDNQSNQANEFIQPKKRTMQRQIHEYITTRGRHGATCAEVEVALGLKHQTASARMSEQKRPDAEFPIFWNGEKRAVEGGRPGRVFVTSEGQHETPNRT